MKGISLAFKAVWLSVNSLPRRVPRFLDILLNCRTIRREFHRISEKEGARWGPPRRKGRVEVGKAETERRLSGVGWWMAEWWWFCVQNQNTGEYGAKGWRGGTRGRWSGSGTRMAGDGRLGVARGIVIYKRRFPRTRPRSEACSRFSCL